MATLLLLALLCPCILSSEIDSESPVAGETCPRIRKSWYTLTEGERDLFVRGFQAIRKNGKLDTITTAHALPIVEKYVHETSLFSAWHGYMSWELETAIRDLGGEFSCFGLPYWDYTVDAGLENDPPFLHSGVGGDGAIDSLCVTSDGSPYSWDLCESDEDEYCYWSPALSYCTDLEIYPNCCLKRKKSNSMVLTTAAQFGAHIFENDDFQGYQFDVEVWHVMVHSFLGADTNAHMVDGYSPDDPAFMMLHAFMSYLRILWSDCYNYDEIPIDELQNYYKAYHGYCTTKLNSTVCANYKKNNKIGLDDKLWFFELQYAEWAYTYDHDVTVRKLYDPSYWNVVYDLGTFWENSGTNLWCEGNLNSNWFVQENMKNSKQFEKSISDEIPHVNKYSNVLRKQLKSEQFEQDEIFDAVSALSCQYVRKHSSNSCWDETFDKIEKETCDVSQKELNAMTLDDMLNMKGVRNNECLQLIRKEMWPYAHQYTTVKQQLCAGEFDYKCPEWDHPDAHKYSVDMFNVINEQKYSLQFAMNVWIMVLIAIFIAICLIISYFDKHRAKSKKMTSSTYGSV